MNDRTYIATMSLQGILAKGTNNIPQACRDARLAADTLLLDIPEDENMSRITQMSGLLLSGIFARGSNNIPKACDDAVAAAISLSTELSNTATGNNCKHNHTLASRCMKCGEVLRIQ